MMYKSILTLAMALSLPMANAQQVREIPELQLTPAVTATANQAAETQNETQSMQPTFGTYAIVAGYSAAKANSVINAETVAVLGEHKVYANAAQAKPTQVTQNTVVRNLISGELAIVTGRISVLTKDVKALNSAIQKLGLKPLKSIRKGQLQMLQAGENADLLALAQQLESLPGVKAVKLDVLDKRNTAQ